ncbi:hypothetical protein ABPG75_001517 [Micractinium tetrahymenae]
MPWRLCLPSSAPKETSKATMLALVAHPACSTLRLSKAGARGGGARGLAAAQLPRRLAGMRVVTAMRPEGEDKDLPSTGREPGFSTSPLTPAFTRRREHYVGRVAAIGFGMSLIGELLTGIGPITQLHYETGLSQKALYIAVLGLAAFGLIGALRPGAPTFDKRNLADASQRGPLANPLKEPRKFMMQNEVYVGRLAMAGFAGACVLEWLWGGEAPLAHLGLIQPGTSLANAPWWTIVVVALFITTGMGLWSAAGDAGRDTESY